MWVSSSCGCGWGGGLQAFLDGFARGLRDPLVARVGGGAGFVGRRWCGQAAEPKATVKSKSDSQGQKRLRRRLRGERPHSGDGGPRCPAADAACGRLCPGFPVASSPNGSRPVRWYQVGSPSWWPGISDLTPPARPAWLRPPKRRGIRDNPGLWCGPGPLGEAQRRPGGVRVRCGNPSHRRGLSRIPRRFGGACTTIPDWAVSSRRYWATATVIRLDTAQAGMVPSGRRSDGESGTKATTSNDRQQPAQPPLPGARPLAAQAPPEAPVSP
ncbi:hypothetical protein ABIA35_008475 [Catenulispora sp. MAP12-49]